MIEQFHWPIEGTLKSTITLHQSGPGSNGNKRQLHIPQTIEMELHHQIQFCKILRTLVKNVTLYRCAAGVFYSPNQQDWVR